MSVQIIPEFITEPERVHLRDAALDYLERGILEANPAGPLRYRRRIYGTEFCDEIMTSIGQRVTTTFGFNDTQVDPGLGVDHIIDPAGRIYSPPPGPTRDIPERREKTLTMQCNGSKAGRLQVTRS